MEKFLDALRNGRVVFDGSMGALLASLGHVSDCPELFNVDSPEVIQGIHRGYIEAGANLVITDSLGANPIKLKHKGIPERAGELAAAAVKNAKIAAAGRAYVALDVGPTGEFLAPVGTYTLEDMLAAYRVQIKAGAEAGADLVLMETMTDIAECRAACLAAREFGLPIVASFTFNPNGRTLTGGSPACAALALQAAGADGLGINCSGGPLEMLKPLREMLQVTPLPVVVQPNAGLPEVVQGATRYPFTPEMMLAPMQEIIAAGASAIGGCCGTTPEHIRLFATLKPVGGKTYDGLTRIASTRQCLPVGEAQSAMAEIDDLEDLYDLEPEDLCAMISLKGLSPTEAAARAGEAQGMTQKPLVFAADEPAALEAALVAYAGVAGAIAPASCAAIIEKYGAVSM